MVCLEYKYFLSGASGLCSYCKDSQTVSNLTECTSVGAAIEGANDRYKFNGGTTAINFPRGCYLYGNRNIYWNYDVSGRKQIMSQQVCKSNVHKSCIRIKGK